MNKFESFIEKGLVFEVDGKWSRKCPTCQAIISNDNKRYKEILMNGINCSCKKCAIKSAGIKKSISQRGAGNHFYGKHHTKESNEKNRLSKLGQKHSEETKKKMSMAHSGEKHHFYGKKHSEESLRKMRIGMLRRVENYGWPTNVDRGAREWFKILNSQGFNYKPKRFWDLGYDADGYDEEKHIWYEFDTPYHRTVKQKKLDLIRQNNIIEYFKKTGNPLNSFIRAEADKTGKVIKEIIYISK